MASCVEIQWGVTPFRGDAFVNLWRPYAEAVIDYGASGFALFRDKDDELIVRQYAYFDDKADWERYWNSERLSQARERAGGMYQVPIIYHWYEVITAGELREPAADGAETNA